MNKKVRKSLLWLAAGWLLPIAFFFSVPLWGTIWHILYGHSVGYAEWKVEVPEGFYVRGMGTGRLHFWRMELGRPLWKSPLALMSFFESPSGQLFHYETDFSLFQKVMTGTMEERGYGSPVVRQVPPRMYCLEFTHLEKESDLNIQCAVEGSPVLVSFEGHRKYVGDFYSMLHKMKAERPPVMKKAIGPRFPTMG